MIGLGNSVDLQVNRKGGWLVIGWANERVYTVLYQYSVPCTNHTSSRYILFL